MNLRKVVDQERLYYIAQGFRKLNRAFASGKLSMINPKIEELLDVFRSDIGESWPEAWIRACKKELGDPLVMHKQNLKHMTVPYWNPTPDRINVFSLGIVKSLVHHEAEVYEFVEPGEQILIPWSYCQGGRNSAVKSVAPQLKPLPVIKHHIDYYDLTPTSYNEWISFFDVGISECCRKQILWDEHGAKCVCQKCGKKIYA